MSLAFFTHSPFSPSVVPPTTDVRIASRLTDLDADTWDRLTGASGFFMSRRYLKLLQQTHPDDLEPEYALVYCSHGPVAAMATQRLTLHRRRLLLCGNAFSWGPHGVALTSGNAWPAVARALETLAKDAGADAILVKDFADPGLSLVSHHYQCRATEPDMVLDLPSDWTSFDDYLTLLKTRYRRAARRVAGQVEDAGCHVESLEDLATDAKCLHGLYLQVHGAARVRLATATPNYLPGLAELCGNDLRCTVIRRGQDIVGFVTILRDGDTAVGYHLGFDRELGRRIPLYVRLLHATVENGIALGCRRLSLGRTALESKARLGARPRPLHVWWRGRGMAGGYARKWANFEPEEVPDRRPFKR